MTTPLFLLRCVQLGISIRDLDLLTIGMVNDMYAESSNDEYKGYAQIATQSDFDAFWQNLCVLYNDNVLTLDVHLRKATDVPGWQSDVKMGFEEMQIALRTRFQETSDSHYAMKLLSDITTGGKITFNDNGIATSVVTQKGVALQANEAIRPIVRLKPYRTFQEVEQPESPFLIRVSERGISFTEADGGMWKLTARETIKKFLEKRLQQEVSEGSVVIAL